MKLLSAKEVAELLHIKEVTVRANAAKGTFGFRCLKAGSMWRFPEDEVMQYIYGKDYKGGENENRGNN